MTFDRLHSIAVAILLAVLFGLGVTAANAAVLVNEFERSNGGIDRIEIFNSGGASVDLTGWTLDNGEGGTVPLSGSIASGAYRTFSTSGLVLEGGQIELYDGTLLLRDEVSFGDQGGAPLPPTGGGFSCGRSPDGTDSGDDASDWNLDPSETFGSTNDNLPANLGMDPAVINEAGRTGFFRGVPLDCSVNPQIEIHNRSPLPLDLEGYWLTDGRQVLFLGDTFIAPFGFAVRNAFPPQFCFEETQVLYLFAPDGRRIDQVGFAGSSLALDPFGGGGTSWQRVPDGAGPNDGFDYGTSGGSSELIIKSPTFGATNGSQPPTGVPDGVETRSWGQTKATYR